MTITTIDGDIIAEDVIEHVQETVADRRSGGLCEICSRRAATEWHLRKSGEFGGTWTPANVLHTCTWCNNQLGRFRIGYDGLGWCIRDKNLDPRRVPVALQHGRTFGMYLLDDTGDYKPAYAEFGLDEAS